jgi:hypothetical protein
MAVSHERNEQDESGVSRRQALKRMAAIGGAVWVAPALQTINMAHAKAGSPAEVCFSVKIEQGGNCESPGPSGQGFQCIVPVTGSDGCSHVSVISTNNGEDWVIDIGSCRFIEGGVKSGGGQGSCCPISIPAGTTGVLSIPRCASGPHGMLQDISTVELTICCDS